MFAQQGNDGVDLLRARLADGAVRALWRTPGRDESWPAWSDAARRLAFQVGPLGVSARADLWSWQPGDAQASPLWITPQRDEGWPAWSPVAAQLAFAFRYRGGSRAPGVALLAFDTSERTAATIAEAPPHTWFLRPRFAPDGASLVAQRREARASQLWILAFAAPPRALADDPAWFHLKGAFTRDGARVLFTRRPAAGGAHDVASVDLRGADLRLHASAPGSDEEAGTPSPTRDELALISDRDGNFEVYLAPLPEGPARRLTHTPDWNEGAPHWSPDGQLLALTAAPRDAPAPRMRSPDTLEGSQVRVIDRSGRLVFEAPGLMPDWMPAW